MGKQKFKNKLKRKQRKRKSFELKKTAFAKAVSNDIIYKAYTTMINQYSNIITFNPDFVHFPSLTVTKDDISAVMADVRRVRRTKHERFEYYNISDELTEISNILSMLDDKLEFNRNDFPIIECPEWTDPNIALHQMGFADFVDVDIMVNLDVAQEYYNEVEDWWLEIDAMSDTQKRGQYNGQLILILESYGDLRSIIYQEHYADLTTATKLFTKYKDTFEDYGQALIDEYRDKKVNAYDKYLNHDHLEDDGEGYYISPDDPEYIYHKE